MSLQKASWSKVIVAGSALNRNANASAVRTLIAVLLELRASACLHLIEMTS
jgi:hypothetical protein